VPGGVPAFISQDTFDKVQVRMEKNKQRPAAMKADEEYILTTKLFCGKCGTMVIGVGGTSRNGTVHHYYKCGNRVHRKTCDKKTVRKAWLERHIVMLTQNYVLCDSVIDRLADAIIEFQSRENTALPFLQKQLTDIEKRIDNLLNAIEEGITNASTKQRLDDLEAKKVDIEIAIAKENIAHTPLAKEQIVFWISRFQGGDIDSAEYRRSIVDIFINSIFLYDDKLVIAFNWKDGTRTITLAELEEAANGGGEAETSLALATFCGSHLVGAREPVAP